MPFEFLLVYLTPILAFLLVITLVYALLAKTKILGENTSINFLISFVVAMIFMIAPAARIYTIKTTPWLAVFLVTLFFFILIISFVGSEGILKSKWLGLTIILVLLALFLVSGVQIFGFVINKYLGFAGLSLAGIRDIILQPVVLGVLVLFVIGAVLSWFLSRK